MKKIDSDAYGKGLKAYWQGKRTAKFTVSSDIAETEKWEIATFFRDFGKMPELEQIALNLCTGKVLDAGAGAGSHALYLQEKGVSVTAIDISEGAVDVMNLRGVKSALQQDFFHLSGVKYDTILMLMNGIGIVQRIENFNTFFIHCKELLAPNGKIVLDSSNIIYMFLDDDGSALIDLNSNYYGEMTYRMDFAQYKGVSFDWIFIDFDTLSELASQNGFSCKKIYEDEHYHYLAELTC